MRSSGLPLLPCTWVQILPPPLPSHILLGLLAQGSLSWLLGARDFIWFPLWAVLAFCPSQPSGNRGLYLVLPEALFLLPRSRGGDLHPQAFPGGSSHTSTLHSSGLQECLRWGTWRLYPRVISPSHPPVFLLWTRGLSLATLDGGDGGGGTNKSQTPYMMYVAASCLCSGPSWPIPSLLVSKLLAKARLGQAGWSRG